MHGHVRGGAVVDGVSDDDRVDHSLSRDGVKGHRGFISGRQRHQLERKRTGVEEAEQNTHTA